MPVVSTSLTGALATTLLGTGPDAPPESPLSWVVLAAARRFSAGADSGADVPASAETATTQTLYSVTDAQVAAAAVVNLPPIVEEEPDFGTPNPTTGAVAGQIVAKDPEGKKLSYTLASGPSAGKLVFDKKTGAFTYTPTASQRVAAGLTPGADYAQFTVKVSDGTTANIQTVTFNVAVNPAELEDAGTIAVGGPGEAITVTKTRVFVTNASAKTVTVIDSLNRTVVATISFDEAPVSVAVTPDGKRLYVVDDTTNLIHVVDATTGTKLTAIDFGENRYPDSLYMSPDGKTLLAAGGLYDPKTNTTTSVITKVATATGKIAGTVKLVGASPDDFYSVAFTPDSKKVYVVVDLLPANPGDPVSSAVYTFATTATSAKLLTTGTFIIDVAVNPAGTLLYVNDVGADENGFGSLRVFDIKSNKLVTEIPTEPERLSGLTFSKDGTLLYTLNTVTNQVGAFDVAAGLVPVSIIDTGTTNNEFYPNVAISPDGRALYYNTDNGLQVVSLLPATAASTPGAPVGNVIKGAFGTRYQVMADVDPVTLQPNGNTRVSILDKDGRVITTTQDIVGIPSSSVPVVRPDGSLLVATYDAGTNTTTITAVSTSGVTTPAGSLTGKAVRQIFIASNGAAYLQTDVNGDGLAYKLVRISTENASQTYDIDGSTSGLPVKLAPDGSAYVVYKDGGDQVSVLAIDPNGDSITVPVGTGSPEGSLAPVVISSDGKAYVTVSTLDAQGFTETKILTFTGTASTERTVAGQQVGSAVVGAKGAVYLVTGAQGTASVTKLTSTTLRTSVFNAAAVGQPGVASDGTAYVLLNTGPGQHGLGIVNPAGKTKIVPINGQFAQAIDNPGGLALTVGYDKKAYVAYVDSTGRYHVAIVGGSGTASIKDMPVGTTTKHSVYFTIRGVAAQMVQTVDPVTGAITGTSAYILPSGKRTEEVPGDLVAGAIDFKNNGYIVSSAENANGDLEVTVLAFTSAGKTLAKIAAPGGIVLAVDNLAGPFGARPVVLSPKDGTAYVTLSTGQDNLPGSAEVWAINPKGGATKVLDVDTALVTAVTVEPDGTAYVTVSELVGGQYVSTVRVLNSTTAV
ncbi:VCBS domain-containing protein [Mycobacterium gallinarum]|uniref:VCBS domain-containing protein n=1 Tax=Mycobacterium gallinarum TaxID=39689 RepID=UPI0013D0416D|nr:VCBS domain-containing protein [Mycobacterium gallinarum]